MAEAELDSFESEEDRFGLMEAELGDELDQEDEFEPVRLSGSQWLKVGLTILASFVVSLILFFPVEDLITYLVYKNAQQVDFQSIELNLFSRDQVKNLRYRGGGALDLSAGRVDSGLSWFGLAGRNLRGPLRVTNVELSNPAFSASIKQLDGKLDLGPLELGGSKAGLPEGSLELEIKNMSFDRIAPLSIDAGVLKVSKATIQLLIENKRLSVRQFNVNSNAFRIKIQKGRINLSDSMATSRLEGELCLTPTPAFRDEPQFDNLRVLYKFAGGRESGEYCMVLEGTLGKPSVKTNPPEDAFVDGEATGDLKLEKQEGQPTTNPETNNEKPDQPRDSDQESPATPDAAGKDG